MNAPITSPEQVVNDPNWFAYGFDLKSGTIDFTHTSREAVAAQTFLDMRWNRAGGRNGRMHLSAVVPALETKPAPRNLRFIWHTGFCCSTLLAQLLDAAGRNISLSEPKLLVDVADTKRADAFGVHPDLSRLPDVAFGLLSRPFVEGEAVTVKPAPAANHLLPEAAALDARHLFLFSDCESFLTSIAKMADAGANYARAMLNVLRRNGVASAWTDARTRDLSIYQIAALVWHLQIAELRASGAEARSLDCDALLDDPAKSLLVIDEFFGLGLGAEHIAETASGPLFRRNAKRPGVTFDARHRREEHAAMQKSFGSELRDAVAWSYEAYGETSLGNPLSNPLIHFEKAYHP
jgi:hypothetical protein